MIPTIRPFYQFSTCPRIELDLCAEVAPHFLGAFDMRALRLLFLALGLIVGLPLGCFLLYWTLELDAVVQKTQETPQQLPAAQLAHKGVPDNLYVELTDFTFG